jgi:hypothetical protein
MEKSERARKILENRVVFSFVSHSQAFTRFESKNNVQIV